jgi:hypothetical protein
MEEEKKKLLEGKEVTEQELQKIREDLPKNKRLVEDGPGNFRILERLQG